ncbi:hypothetical protein C8Q76DRAFT_340438 [Earliella scabrosa]|nr:hypothetical protein C8Q76DRAFT_340438 [Earliella scabrosa]
MASIHSFPSELLAHVFRHFHPTTTGDITRLSLVCRFWRDVLRDTPEFWADLLADPDIITEHDRQCGYANWFQLLARTKCQPFPLALLPQDLCLIRNIQSDVPRISELRLWFDADRRHDILSIVQLGMPHLKTLRCDVVLSYKYLSLDPLSYPHDFSVRFPRLTCIDIHGDFFTPAFVLPTIQRIRIHYGRIDCDSLLSALEGVPLLESLQLERVSYQTNIKRTLPLHLPCLREWWMHHSWPISLIRYITYPSTTDVRIHGSGYRDLLESIPRSAARTICKLKVDVEVRPRNPWGPSLDVQFFGDGEQRMFVSREPYGYWAPKWGDPAGESFLFRDMIHAFSRAPLTALQFDLAKEVCVTKGDWERIFIAFPALVSLMVSIGSCRNLIRVLRKHILPALETLEVTCANGRGVHEPFVSMVERRAAKGMVLKRVGLLYMDGSFPLPDYRLARLKTVVEHVMV